MCGRYNFTAEESAEIRQIIKDVEQRNAQAEWTAGEVFPTNTMPVLQWEQDKPAPNLMIWGFPGFQKSRTIINARAETADSKPMFRNSLDEHRCIIPSTGFYEWDKDKQKYLFRLPDEPELYMAGLFNDFAGEQRYCILTTAANASIEDIHSRMPVILPKNRLHDWLESRVAAEEILHTVPPMLTRQSVSAQTRLW